MSLTPIDTMTLEGGMSEIEKVREAVQAEKATLLGDLKALWARYRVYVYVAASSTMAGWFMAALVYHRHK